MSLLEREAVENYLDVTSRLQYFTLLAMEDYLPSGSCLTRSYPTINEDLPKLVFGVKENSCAGAKCLFQL